MSWNYRVVRHKMQPPGSDWIGLHTVYYDEDGKIHSWCAEPVATAHNLDDLIGELRNQLHGAEMAKGLRQEGCRVLNEAEMPGETK